MDFETALARSDDPRGLRDWLVPHVAEMLASDRARLLAICYRVDVRERDLAAALSAPDVPAALADALIARMVEKQRYRSGEVRATNRSTD